MRIEFRKIPVDGLSCSLSKGKVDFNVKIEKKNSKLLLCEGKMEGLLPHQCDRCGDDMEVKVDEAIYLLVSDKELPSLEDELFNGIEFFDGYADFEEVFNSELESFKSDYFYCEKCQTL